MSADAAPPARSARAAPRGRSLLLHLRLLPGGDKDLPMVLLVCGGLGTLLWLIGLIAGLILLRDLRDQLGPISVVSIATGLPLAVLGAWTGLRGYRSKPLGEDEAGVDLARQRVYLPQAALRVPQRAVLLPIRPRQVQVTLEDGRPLRLVFRAHSDPRDLLRLARLLGEPREVTLEEWVEAQAREFVRDTLPDPGAIREALGEELLRKGVVLTHLQAGAA